MSVSSGLCNGIVGHFSAAVQILETQHITDGGAGRRWTFREHSFISFYGFSFGFTTYEAHYSS
jgi:hypothetical protein